MSKQSENTTHNILDNSSPSMQKRISTPRQIYGGDAVYQHPVDLYFEDGEQNHSEQNQVGFEYQLDDLTKANVMTLEMVEELQHERDMLEEYLGKLLDEIEEKDKMITELSIANEILPTTNNGVGRGSSAEIDILNKRLRDMELRNSDYASLSSERDQLQLLLKQANEALKTQEEGIDNRVNSLVSGHQNLIDELRHENALLKHEVEKSLTLKNRVTGFQVELEVLRKRIFNQSNNKQHSCESSEFHLCCSERCRDMERNISNMKGLLQKEISKNARSEKTIDGLLGERKEYEQALAQVKDEILKLRAAATDPTSKLNIKVIEKNAELARANMALNRKTHELSQVQDDLDKKIAELDAAIGQNKILETRIDVLDKLVLDYRTKLEKSEKTMEELQAKYADFDKVKDSIETSMMNELLRLSNAANETQKELEQRLREKDERIKRLMQ